MPLTTWRVAADAHLDRRRNRPSGPRFETHVRDRSCRCRSKPKLPDEVSAGDRLLIPVSAVVTDAPHPPRSRCRHAVSVHGLTARRQPPRRRSRSDNDERRRRPRPRPAADRGRRPPSVTSHDRDRRARRSLRQDRVRHTSCASRRAASRTGVPHGGRDHRRRRLGAWQPGRSRTTFGRRFSGRITSSRSTHPRSRHLTEGLDGILQRAARVLRAGELVQLPEHTGARSARGDRR